MGARKRKQKVNRRDVLLVALRLFDEEGEGEISLHDLQKTVDDLQRDLPLGYHFSKRSAYSEGLLSDMGALDYGGYLDEYRYRHDSFLPKTFVSLTPLGTGCADEILATLRSADKVITL